MFESNNEINLILQGETSHYTCGRRGGKRVAMSTAEIFRKNLARVIAEKGMTAAEVSRLAGLNLRAVKDIEEGKSQSPKIDTVTKIAKALGEDPGEMLGWGPRAQINQRLAEFLRERSEDDQEQLLSALIAMTPAKSE